MKGQTRQKVNGIAKAMPRAENENHITIELMSMHNAYLYYHLTCKQNKFVDLYQRFRHFVQFMCTSQSSLASKSLFTCAKLLGNNSDFIL